jgi:hypothetical protein
VGEAVYSTVAFQCGALRCTTLLGDGVAQMAHAAIPGDRHRRARRRARDGRCAV